MQVVIIQDEKPIKVINNTSKSKLLLICTGLVFFGVLLTLVLLTLVNGHWVDIAVKYPWGGSQKIIQIKEAELIDLEEKLTTLDAYNKKVHSILINSEETDDKIKDLFNNHSSQLLNDMTLSSKNKELKTHMISHIAKGPISKHFDADLSHYGIDISTDNHEPIASFGDGVVVFSDWSAEYGYTVIIWHGNTTTFYKHCSRVFIRQGSSVLKGDIIALAGSTGLESKHSHLHFELWKNGVPINPEPYISIKKK